MFRHQVIGQFFALALVGSAYLTDFFKERLHISYEVFVLLSGIHAAHAIFEKIGVLEADHIFDPLAGTEYSLIELFQP